MKKLSVIVFLMVLGAGSVVACRRANPPSTEPSRVDETPMVSASPLLSPISVPTDPTPTVSSSPRTPNVVGSLRSSSGESVAEKPVILCLGDVITDQDGTPIMASLDRETASCTQVEADGHFAFVDVAPGQYALFLDLVTSATTLRYPTTGKDVLVDVEAGATVDMGEIVYP